MVRSKEDNFKVNNPNGVKVKLDKEIWADTIFDVVKDEVVLTLNENNNFLLVKPIDGHYGVARIFVSFWNLLGINMKRTKEIYFRTEVEKNNVVPNTDI